jgi:outer membrane protein OmpA-like peptidoglycan-associated protein/LysM repeat protein
MNKSIVLVLLIVFGAFFSDPCFAQKKNSKGKPNPNIILGDKHFDNFEYYLAANEYARVLKADSSNSYAMFQLAECYRLYYNYKLAELYYHKVANRFRGAYPLARYWYAMMLKDNGDYKKAIENFERYRNENSDTNLEIGLYRERALNEINGCKMALSENNKPKKKYGFNCLPSPVNSTESDYAPLLMKNDSIIAITTSRKGNLVTHDDKSFGGSFSDVHRFMKKNDTLWEPVRHIIKDDFDKLNSQYNECSGSFTKGEKKYYFTRCDEVIVVDNYKEVNCAIYVSNNKNGKWENPVKLNNNINPIGQWNSQPSVSQDGNILFFVSKRPGGYGMQDIWFSTCNGDDQWGPATNLGDRVNTLFSDVSPRYYSEEKVLFFSSTGHGGYGALDIFMASEENGFENSVNLGYPFNTNRDDFYFAMGEKTGYITSNREGGVGNDDIYSFSYKTRKNFIRQIADSTAIEEEIDEATKEVNDEMILDLPKNTYNNQKYAQIKGMVIDSLTNKPAPKIEVKIINEYGEPVAKSITDEEGNYNFYNLPSDKEYNLMLKNTDAGKNTYLTPTPKIDYSNEVIPIPVKEKIVIEEPVSRIFPVTEISRDTFANKKSFSVIGSVKDSLSNEAVTKGQIQLIDQFGNVVQISNLDANGNYKVENVTDDKDYKVVYKVTSKSAEKFLTNDYKITFTDNKHVPESTDALIAIIDQSTLPGTKSITIDGIILYADNHKAAPDATILLTDENGFALKTTKTDKNGYYKFSNLGEGDIYKIFLHQGNLTNNSENKKYLAEKVNIKGSEAGPSRQLFENIFFDFDSYTLRNEAKKVLDDLVQYCKGDTAIQIELNANTDSYGSSQYNKILAANRGKAAMDYMMSKGLNQSSMVVNSIGETMSIATNETELGRQLNRRIEFYILGGAAIQSKTITQVLETNKTVYSLAKEYDMTVEELKELNGLVGDELVAYTPIRVRPRSIDHDEELPSAREQNKDENRNSKQEEELINRNQLINMNFDLNNPEYKKYIDSIELADKKKSLYNNPLYQGLYVDYYDAEQNNTFSNIARLYGIPVEKLKAINTIASDTFYVNQKIMIDYNLRDPLVKGYVVKEGDSLEGIAKRFELNIKDLQEINDLRGYKLRKNMVIRFSK